jgi:hypothetical protein
MGVPLINWGRNGFTRSEFKRVHGNPFVWQSSGLTDDAGVSFAGLSKSYMAQCHSPSCMTKLLVISSRQNERKNGHASAMRMRVRSRCSFLLMALRFSHPSMIFILQVEHFAWPPQA